MAVTDMCANKVQTVISAFSPKFPCNITKKDDPTPNCSSAVHMLFVQCYVLLHHNHVVAVFIFVKIIATRGPCQKC